jgi:hypothetical protein
MPVRVSDGIWVSELGSIRASAVACVPNRELSRGGGADTWPLAEQLVLI